MHLVGNAIVGDDNCWYRFESHFPRDIKRHVLDFKINIRLGSENVLDAMIRESRRQIFLQL